MKLCHKDISTLFNRKKVIKYDDKEEIIENELVKSEVDLEKEERLEQVLRKAKEWRTWHLCKDVMVDIVKDVVDMIVDSEGQSAMKIKSLGKGTRSG